MGAARLVYFHKRGLWSAQAWREIRITSAAKRRVGIMGLGLLGQQVGSTVYWASPDGTRRMAEVDAILFQPEASGDYTT